MSRKTNIATAAGMLPKIPAALLDQLVTGPMTPDVNPYPLRSKSSKTRCKNPAPTPMSHSPRGT